MANTDLNALLEQIRSFTGMPEQIREQAEALEGYGQHKAEIDKLLDEMTEAYVRDEIETTIKQSDASLEDIIEHTWGLRRYKVLVEEMVDAAIVRGVADTETQIAEKNIHSAEGLLADLGKLYVEDDRIKALTDKVSALVEQRRELYESALTKDINEDYDNALADLRKIEEFDVQFRDGHKLSAAILQKLRGRRDRKLWLTVGACAVGVLLVFLFINYVVISTGSLMITSEPTGARVYIDDDFEGRTVRQGLFLKRVRTGKHTLVLKKVYHDDASTEIEIRADQRDSIHLKLCYKPSVLSIATEPVGARILINGEEKGKSPFRVEDLPKGTYSVIAELDGYYMAKKEVNVFEGRETADTLVLKKKVEYKKNGLVFIPGGRFTMGSNSGEKDEKPTHDVELNPFSISKYEVTVEQYKNYLNRNRNAPEYYTEGIYKIGDKWEVKAGYENMPVQVDWNRANAFCTYYGYRLPTEAEWEYACRGGRDSDYSFGSSRQKLDEYGWYAGNAGKQLHEVGSKKPNQLGLYDMHGNLWEWCYDWYFDWVYKLRKEHEPVDNPPFATEPPYDASNRRKVRRGGCYKSAAGALRSANRDAVMRETSDRCGFRYVKPKK